LLRGGQFRRLLPAIALPAAVVVSLGATPVQARALRAVECGIISLLAMVAGGLALVMLPLAFMLHRATLGQFCRKLRRRAGWPPSPSTRPNVSVFPGGHSAPTDRQRQREDDESFRRIVKSGYYNFPLSRIALLAARARHGAGTANAGIGSALRPAPRAALRDARTLSASTAIAWEANLLVPPLPPCAVVTMFMLGGYSEPWWE
jgi:hypothetical protein